MIHPINIPGNVTGENTVADERDYLAEAWSKARTLYPSSTHGMPQPTWAVRGFEDNGVTTWDRLTRIVPERHGAISIYVHIPFCRTRCPFCDCHATAIPQKSRDLVEQYVLRFQQETRQWQALGGLTGRPVTTVHLGGGTPHVLQPLEFEKVVQAVATGFGTDIQTEWAIETNCRCLDREHTDQIARLGFKRIHVGIQTLQPRLRSILGRRDSPDTALARIEDCLRRGWVVSADMLYGLPGQTVHDLLSDLQLLVTVGIHGISLYRLNHGAHNHRFMVQHGLVGRGTDRLFEDYRMFMEAAGWLASRGYAKNHFTHFAREQDRNLYSRHAIRGEDLLSLGATADGVFGDYYYRHGELADYLAGTDERPPLQGGGNFTIAERRARRLVTQLMSAQVADSNMDQEATLFVRKLANAGLLCRDESSSSWKLTDAGSWFIGECTADVFHIYETHLNSDAACRAIGKTAGSDGGK